MMHGESLNQERVRDATLQAFGERLVRLEEQNRQANIERNRVQDEVRELRVEMRKGFDEIRKTLAPIATLTRAQKMVFGWLFAILTAAGVMVAIGDKVIAWLSGR